MQPIQSTKTQEFTQAIGKYYNRCDYLYERVKRAIENSKTTNPEDNIEGFKNLQRLAQAKKIAFFDINNGQGLTTMSDKGRNFEALLHEINHALPEMHRADLNPGKSNPSSTLALLRTKAAISGFDLSPETLQECYRQVPSVARALHQEWLEERETFPIVETYQLCLKKLEILVTNLQNGILEYDKDTFSNSVGLKELTILLLGPDIINWQGMSFDEALKPETCLNHVTLSVMQVFTKCNLMGEITTSLDEKINQHTTHFNALKENLIKNKRALSQLQQPAHAAYTFDQIEKGIKADEQKSILDLAKTAQLIYDKYKLSDSTLNCLRERSAMESPVAMLQIEDPQLLAHILSYTSPNTFISVRKVSHQWLQLASAGLPNKNIRDDGCTIL